MRDYTQRFSEGERTLAERYLTDDELGRPWNGYFDKEV